MTTPTTETESMREVVLNRAAALVQFARECGMVLTIETQSRQPLAMGHYDMVVGVRPARVMAAQAEHLWSIYIGGMDEYHAAPSESAAKHMADKHNAAITQWYADCPDETGFRPPLDVALAKVEVWPFDAEEHAEDLLEFDYAGWGLEGCAS